MVELYGPKIRALQLLGEGARNAFEVVSDADAPVAHRELAEEAWRKLRHAEQYIAATFPRDAAVSLAGI